MSEAWASVFRIVVGLFWLYYASQKWQGVGWMHSLFISTAKANPIPGLHEFLVQIAVPNWFLFAVAQGGGETVVAVGHQPDCGLIVFTLTGREIRFPPAGFSEVDL